MYYILYLGNIKDWCITGQSYIYIDGYDFESMVVPYMSVMDGEEEERRMYLEDLSSRICKDLKEKII